MGSIYQRIHLSPRVSGNKTIYPGIDITEEKAPNLERRWSPLRGYKTDWVIDGNKSHQISGTHGGQTKTRKFLTMEGGWYRCRSL